MTTVVISLKDRIICTDSRMTSRYPNGVTKTYDNTIKIHEDCGYIITGSGDSDEIDKFVERFKSCNNRDLLKIKEDCSVAVTKMNSDGELEVTVYYTSYKSWYSRYYKVEQKYLTYESGTAYVCLGSGGSYAFGALKCDKTPYEAVKTAIKCDRYSGGEVQVYDFNDK